MSRFRNVEQFKMASMMSSNRPDLYVLFDTVKLAFGNGMGRWNDSHWMRYPTEAVTRIHGRIYIKKLVSRFGKDGDWDNVVVLRLFDDDYDDDGIVDFTSGVSLSNWGGGCK